MTGTESPEVKGAVERLTEWTRQAIDESFIDCDAIAPEDVNTVLTAYQERGTEVERLRKPKRDEMIERTDEEWERFEHGTVVLYSLKPGDVLTEEVLADLLFADDCCRNDDEAATDAYHRGREEGLRERGGDELLELTQRAERYLTEKSAERALKVMAQSALSTARDRIAALEGALSLVRMSMGWQYMAEETKAIIRSALLSPSTGEADRG